MTEQTFIYVMGAVGGPQKIGIAASPEKRRAMIQTGHAAEIVLAATVLVEKTDSYRIEQSAHWLLREHHMRGEWFNVTPGQALAAVNSALDHMRRGDYIYETLEGNTRGMKISAALKAARAEGRIGGRRETFTDAQISEVMHLGSAKGAKALGMSKTQFIRRVERLRKKEAANG